ncbi:hypothetical protein [Lederbergia graminis]|uniref:LysM domain-containing protein n=1 Tax=Lederbergia graminis TaxID=735518 RepID=A0ABW0LFA5_9BACI|nr:hypothetical protein [Bacillaceae bacterium]
MKRVFVLFAAIITMYAIYYDLTAGTLPTSSAQQSIAVNNPVQIEDPTYEIIKILPGDTVISVMEKIQQGPIPVSIDQLVTDFEKMNEGIKPEQIQIGKSYKFPTYNE